MRLLKILGMSFALWAGCQLLSCGKEDFELEGTLPINIVEVFMPEIAEVNQDVEIQIHAEAPNGCFRDLKIMIRPIDSQHYLLRATGFLENSTACPAVVVKADTVIVFRPTVAGEYYFQTNEDPFPIRRDTLTIL